MLPKMAGRAQQRCTWHATHEGGQAGAGVGLVVVLGCSGVAPVPVRGHDNKVGAQGPKEEEESNTTSHSFSLSLTLLFSQLKEKKKKKKNTVVQYCTLYSVQGFSLLLLLPLLTQLNQSKAKKKEAKD